MIFDILAGAIYEITTSEAYYKRNSSIALFSLFLSHVVVFLYVMEMALMWYQASKLSLKKLLVPKNVKIS